MSAEIVLHVGEVAFHVESGGEPLIRAIDLAIWLGYDQPRNIRKLVGRLEQEGEIVDVLRRSTVERQRVRHGEREFDVDEYFLNEEQALLVAVRSEAPRARDVRRVLVRTFIAARKQREIDEQSVKWLPRRLIEALLLPKPTADWERMFPDSLVREICRLDGIPWSAGPHPRHLASTNRKIYDTVFSSAVGRAIKARNPLPRQGKNHHQHLTPDAREYLRVQLGIIEAIARGSASKADFWIRMSREYAGGMLQLGLEARP